MPTDEKRPGQDEKEPIRDLPEREVSEAQSEDVKGGRMNKSVAYDSGEEEEVQT